MPRPTKAIRRQKLNAAAAWKRGDKEEAYKLWAKAAGALKEHQAKKRDKHSSSTVAAAAPAEGS
jgi:ABC-type taurine transport system substrate-binding protein